MPGIKEEMERLLRARAGNPHPKGKNSSNIESILIEKDKAMEKQILSKKLKAEIAKKKR